MSSWACAAFSDLGEPHELMESDLNRVHLSRVMYYYRPDYLWPDYYYRPDYFKARVIAHSFAL